ncbi:unnamed protein product [Polarella glacialis]|uniref:Uncharacterized protein n=1 Tax=Polarella glacialis TaxID=89957 RepID=A0A813DC08_POLGL|nr:unnamed protein product [Polarella glacialis]
MEGLPAGMQVRISGLKGEAALNGQVCVSLGPSGTTGRVLVRLQGGRELAVRAENLSPAGTAGGTLTPGSRVVLVGLAKAPTLNGREGTVLSKGEAGSGRFLVDLGDGAEQAKALKAENLILLNVEPAADKAGEGDQEDATKHMSEKERKATKAILAAAKGFPAGSHVIIHGIEEGFGRENSGDPALNDLEGVVERLDPDGPGRLIVRIKDRVYCNRPENKETLLKSIHFDNMMRLDASPEEEPTNLDALTDGSKRPASALTDASGGTVLQVFGAGGKRCKITEIAVASGDKTASFASANRNRDFGAADAVMDETARSNLLVYARTDAASKDDAVCGPALTRLALHCPGFAMKAVCVLAVDIASSGSGKMGSKTADLTEALAKWLTGGESDGLLRKQLKEGQECAGEKDGPAACRKCAGTWLQLVLLLFLLLLIVVVSCCCIVNFSFVF